MTIGKRPQVSREEELRRRPPSPETRISLPDDPVIEQGRSRPAKTERHAADIYEQYEGLQHAEERVEELEERCERLEVIIMQAELLMWKLTRQPETEKGVRDWLAEVQKEVW